MSHLRKTGAYRIICEDSSTYWLAEPACEVNERGNREKNDGNEDVSMDDNEKIDVDSDAGSFAEEDWIIQSRTRCKNGRIQTCRRQ